MKNDFVISKDELLVYTALFGEYDNLIEPSEKFLGCKFICITDRRDLKSEIWEIILITDLDLPGNMMNRKYKMLPNLFLKDLGKTLYVDANIKIKENPRFWIDKNPKSIQIPVHFARDCIFDEAVEVIKNKKAPEKIVQNQMSFYLNKGMPKKFGLFENNIIYRNYADPSVFSIMLEWWDQINKFSQRDQLSLMYVLWRNNYKVSSSRNGARGNKFFSIRPHTNRKKSNNVEWALKYQISKFIDNYPNSFISAIFINFLNFLKNILKNS